MITSLVSQGPCHLLPLLSVVVVWGPLLWQHELGAKGLGHLISDPYSGTNLHHYLHLEVSESLTGQADAAQHTFILV